MLMKGAVLPIPSILLRVLLPLGRGSPLPVTYQCWTDARICCRLFLLPKILGNRSHLRGASGCSSPHSAAGSGILLLVHFQPSRESGANAKHTLALPSTPPAPCFSAFCSIGRQGGKERGAHPGFPLPKPLSPQYVVPLTSIRPATNTGMPAEVLAQGPKWWPL